MGRTGARGWLPGGGDTFPPAGRVRGPGGDWTLAEGFDHGGYAKVPAELEAFAVDFERRHRVPVERVYVAKLLWALTALTESGTFPGAPPSRPSSPAAPDPAARE